MKHITICQRCKRQCNRHVFVQFFGQGPGAYTQRNFCTIRCLIIYYVARLGWTSDFAAADLSEEDPEVEQVRRFDREAEETFAKEAKVG